MRTHALYIIMCFAGLFLTTACNNYLNEEPRNSLSDNEAYGSLTALKNNTVLDIYNYIGGNTDSQGLQGTNRGVFDLNSLTTDEAIIPTRGGDWYDGGLWQRLFTHSWSTTEAMFYDTWNYLYKVVMLCNDHIEQIARYKDTHPAETETNEYIAELRAVRAIYYFYILDLFGNVPLVTNTNATSSGLKQSARSKVFSFAVKELQESLPLLSTHTSNANGTYYGRVTRPVAMAYLAKLMLNAEVYSDDNWTDGIRTNGSDIHFSVNGQDLNAWEATVAYCDSLSIYYKLETDFSENFQTNNEASSENIFTIPMTPNVYSNVYNYFFRSRHYCHGAALGGASENGTSATIEMLDAMGYDTDNEDPRFRMTFYADDVWVNGEQVMMDDGVTPLIYSPREVKLILTGSQYVATAGARLAKYAADPDANADGRACHNDIVLLRYADILLMKAEALVRDGKDGSEPLNIVRNRVGLPAVTATLDNILHERFVELAWEGWRRNDMVRFGIFANAYTDHPTLTGEESGYTTVFPIPYEMMTMHPDWVQNEGY